MKSPPAQAAPAAPAAKLTASAIRSGIEDVARELEIAIADENAARLRAGQARARAALGHGGFADADAALNDATRHRVALEEERASLDALLPEAGYQELLAEREARRKTIAANEDELRTASARLNALRTELATLDPRVNQLRAAVSNGSLTGIDRRIAEYRKQHRAALEAAGAVAPSGTAQQPMIADVQNTDRHRAVLEAAGFVPTVPAKTPPPASANLADFQVMA